MGYSQGKMPKPEELQNQSSLSKDSTNEKEIFPINDNYKIISKTNKKNVDCFIIEFLNNDNKQVDCEISLNRINFEEAYDMDFIFASVVKVFENMGINLPLVIYLNIENARINIFLKLKSVDEIIVITNKFISLIKNFNKLMKFTNDIDYKVHKKPEIQSNYSPLNSNNSYVNCFANPNKGNKVNSCFNNINDNLVANQSKLLTKEKIENNNPAYQENSIKKEFIELMPMDNIEKTNLRTNTLCNRKRMLTFDDTFEPDKNAFENKNSSTNITNDTLINIKNANEDPVESFFENAAQKAELPVRESSNKKLRIQTESEENLIDPINKKEAGKNSFVKEDKIKIQESSEREKKYELSEGELERMYFMEQNQELFENQDVIMQQPKEEIEKLVNELAVNKQSAGSSDNLLLNENFLNSENTMNRISFEDGENNYTEIPADSTANNIIECSFNNQKTNDELGFEHEAKLLPPLGKLGKNIKFTFEEPSLDNAKKHENNSHFELKEKEKKLNEILQEQRFRQNKETVCNNNHERDCINTKDISNKNQHHKRNPTDNNQNNFTNYYSKNSKKFSFPNQQNIPSYQSNVTSNSNIDVNNNSSLMNSNNFGENLNEAKNKNTRNYYINNILNFNPNNNFTDNPKMQNISNINAMMNPSLINHNMLLMMKKFNQNSQQNNQVFNQNLLPNQGNNFDNAHQMNPNVNSNNFPNFNNYQPIQINNENKAFTNNLYNQSYDQNNKNYFINNNLNGAFMNPFINSNSNQELNKDSKNSSKDFEAKIEYLEDKVKLISLDEDSLEGFYFIKTDYISDEDFISFYFLGNLKSLVDSNKKDSAQSESEIRENYTNILSKYFKEKHDLKLKHIIQNPSESESISRLVFYKINQTNEINTTQIFKETDGLEHEKICINNHNFILMRIKSLVLKLHPEELYVDLQLKLNYEINNFDERDFVNFLENTLEIDFFEISFIAEGECVLTFYKREVLKELINIFQQKPYHQIKRPLKKVRIETSVLTEPFPIQGKKINLLYDDEENESESEKVYLPQRPPVPIRVLAGNYTPTLQKLLSSKEIWSEFKIEKHNLEVANVEQFYNEICKCDIEILSSLYNEKYEVKDNHTKNIAFTILDYVRKPKKIKKQLNKIMEDEETTKPESEKFPTDKPNLTSVDQLKKTYLKSKDSKKETESSSEVEFSSSDRSQSSFSMRNIEESDLDLDENNQSIKNKKYSSRIEPQVKIYKKRGRKPKSELISGNNQVNSDFKSSSHRNDYGKKFISNNLRRNYNHSRYNVNNLQIESSIDISKPNILDEIIKNNLNNGEKNLLEKIEKEVEQKIFHKNSCSNDFLPRKRGRKPKADCIEELSENLDYYRNDNSNKVPLDDRNHWSNKGNDEISESDPNEDFKNENKNDCNSDKGFKYENHFAKGENKYTGNKKESNFIPEKRVEESLITDGSNKFLGGLNDNFDKINEKDAIPNEEDTLENIKSKCIDEDVINMLLSRTDV